MRTSWLFKYAVILILPELLLGQAQQCLQPADSQGRQIPFEDLGSDSESLPSRSQAIITSYQFQCCGNVTAWQTYVSFIDDRCGQCTTIHFQVWRPSESVDTDGCYSLVGEDRYTSIRFQGMADVFLVNRTLEAANFLSVQPGDVVGFQTPRSGRSGRIQLNRNYHNESVWFTTNIDSEDHVGEPCPSPVGRNGVLQNFSSAAPVLSVAITPFSCPFQTPTSASAPTTRMSTGPPTSNPDTTSNTHSNTASNNSSPSVSATTTNPPIPTTNSTSPSNTSSNTSSVTSGLLAGILAGVGCGAVLVVILVALAISVGIIRRKVKKKNGSVSSTLYNECSKSMEMKQNAAYIKTPNIATSAHSVDPDHLYATVEGEHQQLTQNQAYVTTTNIPVETNQCYGTTTPSVDLDQLYATVEGEHNNIRHISQRLHVEENDYNYVIT